MIAREDVKVGDIVVYNGNGSCDMRVGAECRVDSFLNGGVCFTELGPGGHDCWESLGSFDYVSRPLSVTINKEIDVTSGEDKVEEVNRPEFIIVVKNTEVFKKGGVFQYYSSFYAPVDRDEAFTVKPYGDPYIRLEQADILLQKKVAVEAVKFNPEFVTLEQNEALVKALEQVNKPKATKKAPAKKSTVKKASK